VTEQRQRTSLRGSRWWLFPIAVALVLRVVAALAIDSRYDHFLFGDSVSYWDLAGDLARGGPYEYGWEGARCFRTPGYPAMLSPLFWIWTEPPLIAARLWGAVLGTCVVGLVARLANRFGGKTVGFFAAWLAALHPELIVSSSLVLSETTFEIFLTLQLLCWVGRDRVLDGGARKSWTWPLALGGWAGIASLVRPSWLAALPVWFLALLLDRWRGGVPANRASDRLRQTIVFCLAAAFVMAPWWIRNAVLYERWIPTSLQVGASLYDGLHDGATGGSDLEGLDAIRLDFLRREVTSRLPPAEADAWLNALPSVNDRELYWRKIREQVPPLWLQLQAVDATLPPFEVAFDRELRRMAWDWAGNHPQRVVELAGLKALRLWSPWPQKESARSTVVRMAYGIAFFGCLGLAIAGIRTAGQWRDAWILVAPALGFTVLHLLHVASIRYREPSWVGLLVLAAAGAASIVSRLGWGKGAEID